MKVEAITSQRDIRDPALPEELPGWTKFDTKSDGTVEIKFKLPFPSSLRSLDGSQQTPVMKEAELVVIIPVGKFAIFTEECAVSTRNMLGVKGGKRLLDAIAQDYYKGLILAQLSAKE